MRKRITFWIVLFCILSCLSGTFASDKIEEREDKKITALSTEKIQEYMKKKLPKIFALFFDNSEMKHRPEKCPYRVDELHRGNYGGYSVFLQEGFNPCYIILAGINSL